MKANSLRGAEYFLTFIDDKTRYIYNYGCICFEIGDAFAQFKEWNEGSCKSQVEDSSKSYALTMVVNLPEPSLRASYT